MSDAESVETEPAVPLFHRIAARAMLMLAIALTLMLLRAVRAVDMGQELGWFAFTDHQVQCVAQSPGCGALTQLVYRVNAWSPLAILSLVSLALLLGSGRWQDGRWGAEKVAAVAVGISALPPLILFIAPEWSVGHVKLAMLAVAGALLLVIVNALLDTDAPASADTGAHPRISELLASIGPLRVHLVIAVLYVLLFLVVEQASGQALDAVRSWDVTSAAGLVTIGLGFATCLLLTFGMRVSAELIESACARPPGAFNTKVWLAIGAGLVVVGFVLKLASPVDDGLMVLGGVIFLLGLLGLYPPEREAETQDADPRAKNLSTSKMAELVTAAPFQVLACALLLVAFDQYWVDARIANFAVPTGLAVCAIVLGAILSVREPGTPVQAFAHTWSTRVGTAAILAPIAVAPLVTLHVREPVVTGLTVAGLLVLTYVAFRWEQKANRERALGRVWTPLIIMTTVGAALAIHQDPLTTGEVFGVVAFVNLGACFVLAVGTRMVALAMRVRPPRGLHWIGAKSLPVLTPFLVWWAVTGVLLPDGMHNIEVVDRGEVEGLPAAADRRTPTLEDAFAAWVSAQPEMEDPESDQVVPMVLVTAHGGGIRAAYWTTLVLDCVIGHARVERTGRKDTCQGASKPVDALRNDARRVFLASGVSGGSLGLAAYAQNLLSDDPGAEGWMDDRLGSDYASPTVGWGVLHDLPNHLLGIGSRSDCHPEDDCLRKDRASLLADRLDEGVDVPPQLRQTWDERLSTDVAVRERAETVPVLVFNTTAAGAAFGELVSAVKLGHNRLTRDGIPDVPGTEGVRPTADADILPLSGQLEAVDLLCSERDLKLSTASVLSARFPVVSPSGRLEGTCAETEGMTSGMHYACQDGCDMRMVDGGYLDNSGMLTLSGILPELKRLIAEHNAGPGADIAPFVIDIDSAYQSADNRLTESLDISESAVPLRSSMVRGAVERYARGRVFRSLSRGCVFTIAPAMHPGLLAPLGWSLSDSTRSELRRALDDPSKVNVNIGSGRLANLKKAQLWLSESEAADEALASCRPG